MVRTNFGRMHPCTYYEQSVVVTTTCMSSSPQGGSAKNYKLIKKKNPLNWYN